MPSPIIRNDRLMAAHDKATSGSDAPLAIVRVTSSPGGGSTGGLLRSSAAGRVTGCGAKKEGPGNLSAAGAFSLSTGCALRALVRGRGDVIGCSEAVRSRKE